MIKLTAEQRRQFIMSLLDAGLSYEKITVEAIKTFGKENLPKGYNKRLVHLDMRRALNKKNTKKLKTELRRNKIFQFRMAGMSFQQILQKLREEFGEKNLPRGYCERHVCRDLRRYLNKIESENRQELIETRNLQRERLNFLLNILWQKASQGDFQAIDRTLKIMDALTKLDGIDGVTSSTASPPEKMFNTFAELSEYFSNLNGKGNGNGKNNE